MGLSTRSEGGGLARRDRPKIHGLPGAGTRVPAGRFIGGLFHGVQSHGVCVATEGRADHPINFG